MFDEDIYFNLFGGAPLYWNRQARTSPMPMMPQPYAEELWNIGLCQNRPLKQVLFGIGVCFQRTWFPDLLSAFGLIPQLIRINILNKI